MVLTCVPVPSKVVDARLTMVAATSGLDSMTSLIGGECSVKVWRHATIEDASAGALPHVCVACIIVILS